MKQFEPVLHTSGLKQHGVIGINKERKICKHMGSCGPTLGYKRHLVKRQLDKWARDTITEALNEFDSKQEYIYNKWCTWGSIYEDKIMGYDP